MAEGILAAPITLLPADDPVRVETAAYRRNCMLDGTTPPAWVLELVLPGIKKTVSGPSDKQIAEVRGAPSPQENLDVLFERVQHPPTPATPIQQQSSSSDSSRTSPPDHPAPLTAPTTSAVGALPTARTTSAVAPPSSHYHNRVHGELSMNKSDLPPWLRLHGLPSKDVPEIMALFYFRIRLHAPDGTPDSVIDHHAVRYLAHSVSGGAASTMHQVQCETLEWRTNKEVKQLNTQDVEVRAPRYWSEWVDVFTNLFRPVNRIVPLECTVSTLRQRSSESVDAYRLRVTQAYARLLAESKRSTPANVSPYKHAWQTSLMVTFEAGLIPHVRLEVIREDPSLTYQASRTRAKKHENNALSAAPTLSSTTYASAVTGTSPGPDRQVITSMANIRKAIVSKLTAVRSRGKSVTFKSAAYGPSDKRGRSPSGDAGKSRKAKVASGKEYAYPTCRHRSSLSRQDRRLAKAHKRDGIIVTQKPCGGPRRLPQTGSGSRHTMIIKPAVETIARSASVAVVSAGRPSSKRRTKCGRSKSTTPLASTRAKQAHADNQSNTVTDLQKKQQVPIVLAAPRGVGPAPETTGRRQAGRQACRHSAIK